MDDQSLHPGGQRTASAALVAYAATHGYDLEIIDTTQSSFPVPPLCKRLVKGWARIALLIRLLHAGGLTGVILFASSGFSVLERLCMSALCRAFRVPDVLFVRSGHFMNSVHSSTWTSLWARLLLRIPFRVGAQGQTWVDFYKSLGVQEARIVLARNWLPPSTAISCARATAETTERVHFIFVGWLIRAKGIGELLEAIDRLRPQYRFRFTIVGGGTLYENVKRHIESRGWTADVAVLGWKSRDEVEALLKRADVFVLPSHAEGFPNALLEAMAKGLPAICSDVGGIRDSVIDGENGFLIPPLHARALAEAMTHYLDDPELIKKHSRGALRMLRKNHDWESNCKKVFDVFDLTVKDI